jgi:hypothetical protein
VEEIVVVVELVGAVVVPAPPPELPPPFEGVEPGRLIARAAARRPRIPKPEPIAAA